MLPPIPVMDGFGYKYIRIESIATAPNVPQEATGIWLEFNLAVCYCQRFYYSDLFSRPLGKY